jgi:hypothetical protein
MAIALGGCAATRSNLNYTRADNRAVDAAQEQATLAQCKGEAANAAVQSTGGAIGVVERARKETTLVDACMARNGYIQAPQ